MKTLFTVISLILWDLAKGVGNLFLNMFFWSFATATLGDLVVKMVSLWVDHRVPFFYPGTNHHAQLINFYVDGFGWTVVILGWLSYILYTRTKILWDKNPIPAAN